MGDILPKFKAAAVQAAPVFLDREASIEKACSLIRKAGENGADLIVLPEVFIPGGPYWAWDMSMSRRLGIDTLKPGGAWSSIIEAGSGHLMAGARAPDEEGIIYGDIDLNDATRHYFLHETTGHYWPKQFRVYFDSREMKPLNIVETLEKQHRPVKETPAPNGLPEQDGEGL
jgi:hypothetical protein